ATLFFVAISVFFLLMLRRPPLSPLFPYTTLFRSSPRTSSSTRSSSASVRDRGRRLGDRLVGPLNLLGCAPADSGVLRALELGEGDRKSTRLNSSHVKISYAVFCLKKKKVKNKHCR